MRTEWDGTPVEWAQGGGGGGTGGGTAAPAPTNGVPIPTTAMEIRGLRARRWEAGGQSGNITSRRDDIASQLRAAAPGVDRTGLEGRLAVLDRRIVELENDPHG